MSLLDWFERGEDLHLAGGPLRVRPLNLEQLLRLDAALGHLRGRLPEWLAGEVGDGEDLVRAVVVAVSILWPDRVGAVQEAVQDSRSLVWGEVGTLLAYFNAVHDWERISAELFTRDGAPADPNPEATVEVLLRLEFAGGRRVEDVLRGMTVEAALAYMSVGMDRLAQMVGLRLEAGKKREGRAVSDGEAMGLLPADAEYWAAWYQELQDEAGACDA